MLILYFMSKLAVAFPFSLCPFSVSLYADFWYWLCKEESIFGTILSPLLPLNYTLRLNEFFFFLIECLLD